MSWMVLHSDSGHVEAPSSTTDGGFTMNLGSDTSNMPLQPYDTMLFDTLIPLRASTTALKDATSSTYSRPLSPKSDPTTFPDTSSVSDHTSPREITPEPSSSTLSRHSYNQLLRKHSENLQIAGTKRRHSEIYGRSTGSPETTASSTSQSLTLDTTALPGSNKKMTIREKNRTAAAKCRNKKKCEIAELQETAKQLSEKNSTQSAYVKYLRDEILALNMEILRHGTCESHLIQDYIMERVGKLGLDQGRAISQDTFAP
ncbi:uncharacterized protein B0I36DRAFT_337466 [Microdochium trichocladiopsis]|uniref:BZIP domain-containing protein n=1 Tax=Microdochium trichocladiopsis TaxID=1682393 RepID=A0A9P9BJ48_9PEZI|nr:uncharacterized protein B0I36DRAFT_337466 [Microdochium trichocladiopsis]KAH7016358.1 hypothetical protein B0I36DRAFT_337466 [Microdochium trichocladiopsis]